MKFSELLETSENKLKNVLILSENFKDFYIVWDNFVKRYVQGVLGRNEDQIISDYFSSAIMSISDNTYGIDHVFNSSVEMLGLNSEDQLTPPVILEYLIRNKIKINTRFFSGNPNDISSWIGAVNRVAKTKVDSEDIEDSIMDMYKTFGKHIIKRLDDELFSNSEYDVIARGSNFTIYQAHNMAAACKLGQKGKWCISTKNVKNNHFNAYNDNGRNVYIIHTEQGGPWSVIANDKGRFIEVQNEDNNLGSAKSHLNEFFRQLEDVGVDIDEFMELFPSKIPKPENITLDEAVEYFLDKFGYNIDRVAYDVFSIAVEKHDDYFNYPRKFFKVLSEYLQHDVNTMFDVKLGELIRVSLDVLGPRTLGGRTRITIENENDFKKLLLDSNEEDIEEYFSGLIYFLYKHFFSDLEKER